VAKGQHRCQNRKELPARCDNGACQRTKTKDSKIKFFQPPKVPTVCVKLPNVSLSKKISSMWISIEEFSLKNFILVKQTFIWMEHKLRLGCLFILLVLKLISAEIPILSFGLVNTYWHDKEYIPVGLVYNDTTGLLYEGSGYFSDCYVAKRNLAIASNFEVNKCNQTNLVGAGLTLFENNLYQVLEFRSLGFMYNTETLEAQPFNHSFTPCWGLTNDNTHFILSNGSNIIKFLNKDFSPNTTLMVTEDGKPLDTGEGNDNGINELEYIEGEIWANVWHTLTILRIDLTSGSISLKKSHNFQGTF
jgi:glutamine cyclotransferase